jgi:hypothetical protein
VNTTGAESKQAHLAEALCQAEATVVAEDECDMHVLAIVRAIWQRLGQQLRIATCALLCTASAHGQRLTTAMQGGWNCQMAYGGGFDPNGLVCGGDTLRGTGQQRHLQVPINRGE